MKGFPSDYSQLISRVKTQPVLSPESVHVQGGVWSYLHWKESLRRLSNDNSWERAVRMLGARAWNEAVGQRT